jgi:uncharacterized membrane protein YccC
MANFIKHVGKVGDRKVAVVFREIPGEEHMCLCVYTETLNQNIHDPLISAIESEPAQRSEDGLADALNKNYTRDGKILLQVLHHEGMLKKVQTEQVMMTPSPKASIRLNKLNEMLNEMKKGEDAIKRLQEMDESRGLQDPKDIARRMREQQPMIDAAKAAVNAANNPVKATMPDVYGDAELAQQRLQQAQRMAAEARGLLAESSRLEQEAYSMNPALAPQTAPATTKKTRAAKVEVAVTPQSILAEMSPAPKKAGRPRKAAVAS